MPRRDRYETSPHAPFTPTRDSARRTSSRHGTRPTSRTLVTFGSPLVGDTAFAAPFAKVTVARFVDRCDLVARVPPEAFDDIRGMAHSFRGQPVD